MNSILPSLIGEQIGKYKIVERKGEGDFGITYKAIDTTLADAPVAIKFLKPTYQDPNWKEEALKASKLRDAPQIAYIIEVNESSIIINNIEYHLRYLVWEYVDGEPLQAYMESSAPIVTEFIMEIIRQLCLGIKAMQEIKLEHGDLHTRNILLIPPKSYEPSFNYRVKIIDFGLSKTFRGNKFKNDMEYVADLLERFWDKNRFYIEDLKVCDKRFNQSISTLIKQLEDSSLERRVVDPIQTIKRLEEIKELTKIEISETNGKLKHPFEYLSAEEMPENSDLLYFLYSSGLPWYNELEGFGNVVISGPRGCGKSMILKNLRLQTKLMSRDYQEKLFGKERYVGFYIHCHSNLYLPFAGVPVDYSDFTIQQAFIHYINLLFTQEVLSTLKLTEQLKVIDITTSAKENIINFMKEKLFQIEPPLIANVDLLSYLTTYIEKESILIQRYILRGNIPQNCTYVNYLNELCNLLKNNIEYFKDKQIYFILDDYSHPKVPFEIQKAFNRIVGVRNNDYCFKISSEKFSFSPTDLDLEKTGKEFQQGREFAYIDLGGKYLSYLDLKKERKEFIKEIIDKRLKRTPEVSDRDTISLFSIYKFPKGNIAESLVSHYKRKKGKKETLYAGLDVIYSLCGGDIHTILELCKNIYDKAKIENELPLDPNKNISYKVQNEVIEDFSQRRLERIKEILNYGQDIYHIIEVFGEIAKTYLYEYGPITKEPNRYYEISRIEIEGSGELSGKAFELYKSLLVEGIFSDAGGRYPWGKGLLNPSLFLRPIFTPALQISYRRREALRLNVKRFENFLLYPDRFKKTGTKFLKELLGEKDSQIILDFDQQDEFKNQPRNFT